MKPAPAPARRERGIFNRRITDCAVLVFIVPCNRRQGGMLQIGLWCDSCIPPSTKLYNHQRADPRLAHTASHLKTSTKSCVMHRRNPKGVSVASLYGLATLVIWPNERSRAVRCRSSIAVLSLVCAYWYSLCVCVFCYAKFAGMG